MRFPPSGEPKLGAVAVGRSAADDGRVLVAFSCQTGTELLEVAHAFVDAYTKLRFRPLVAQRVTLAAYELLSNALAYGSVAREVGFELVESRRSLEVRVTNEAVASRIAVLTERVQRLETDADAVYVEEIRRTAAGGPRAMLGLARVRHEGECRLAVIRQDAQVTVIASNDK